MTKTFIIRAISALVAVAGLGLLYYFLENTGLKLVCYLAVVVGGLELLQILLPPTATRSAKALFFVFLLLIFHGAAHYPSLAGVGFAVMAVAFLMLSLFFAGQFENLADLIKFQAGSILGFIYVGLFPSYAFRLLDLHNGLRWFTALLAVVFAGDVCAYCVGVFLGRHKISPRLSPKKSWEGATGGVIGSLLAGFGSSYFLPDVSLVSLLLLALTAGLCAQFGDFFESLLKRVADVKDSGSLMPGHGGVLDRLDGVLFASPVVLLAASLIEAGFQL
jgi:phosphatidate cytidylyltransferase